MRLDVSSTTKSIVHIMVSEALSRMSHQNVGKVIVGEISFEVAVTVIA